MKLTASILLLLSAGCIPLGRDADLTREANWVAYEVGLHPATRILAEWCIGSPAAIPRGDTITAYVPLGWPAAATLRYELAKLAVQFNAPWWARPALAIDAMLHGPVTEAASWLAMTLPPERPREIPRDRAWVSGQGIGFRR